MQPCPHQNIPLPPSELCCTHMPPPCGLHYRQQPYEHVPIWPTRQPQARSAPLTNVVNSPNKPDSKFEICIFNISHHPCSQVCKGGLRLLSGTAVLQEVAIETLAALIPASGVPGSPGSVFITGAAVCDPYLLLRLSDDRALLLCASPETGAEGLPVLWSLLPESRIRGCVCVCVHSIPYLG